MRTLLRSYGSRAIAEIVAAKLRELDLPVVVMHEGESFLGAGGTAEVWLEDETILENETWRKQIQDVLEGDAMTINPAEEEFIASMPIQDVPPKSNANE